MSVQLFASNDLKRLGRHLMHSLSADLRVQDPAAALQAQIIIVPTAGLRDWLRQLLASGLGICGGIAFCHPGELRQVLKDHCGIDAGPCSWDSERARWRCLELLPAEEALEEYLGPAEQQPSLRAFDLATAIVDCFERYGMYRPQDTLLPWSKGIAGAWDAEAPWQNPLWRALLEAGCGDPVADHHHFLHSITTKAAQLPARLHAFGFNTIAPHLLTTLGTIGSVTDVHIYSLQPSWGYWGDDQRQLRDLVRDRVDPSEWGNRMLGNWGMVGRDFLCALDDVGADYLADMDDFTDPGHTCLLHRLQHDLLYVHGPNDIPPHNLSATDHSIAVHACHHLRRQIEVCKAAIHQALAADPSLAIHEIAVMCPDPTAVAPLAQAIFDGSSHGPALAVAIADRTPRMINSVAEILLKLLQLLPGRFTAGDVLDFLGSAPIAAAWGLGADELDRVRGWIDRADLRWGVDARHRADAIGHTYAAGSWRRGLQRLQLAWWYGADTDQAPAMQAGDDAAEAVVPVADFQPEEFDTLKRISLLLQPILDAAEPARRAQDVDWWHNTIIELLSHVMRAQDSDPDLAEVSAIVANWAAEVTASGMQEALPADIVHASFLDRLNKSQGGDFGRGAITICGMQPMRSVPFRMLCLIGMDDGAFPREGRRFDFDLLRKHPQPGDRDLRQEDRYLLLELLLSVRDRLCVTFQGFDARDNTELPPSSLIGELLDNCIAVCEGPDKSTVKHLLHQHRLHGSAEVTETWPSIQVKEEALALATTAPDPQFAAARLPPLLERRIDNEELIAFWRCPARSYLRRLGLHVPHVDEAPRDHERFTTPAGLDRYTAAQRLLNAADDGAALRDRLAAEGWLPPGALGHHAWGSLHGFIDHLKSGKDSILAACRPQAVNLQIDGMELQASYGAVHPTRGVVLVHPGKRNTRQELNLWINSLLAHSSGLGGALLLCLDGNGHVEEFSFGHLAKADALLQELLQGYSQGMQEPLPFAPETSRSFAHHAFTARRPVGPALARQRAVQVWAETNDLIPIPAEHSIPAHRIVWPGPGGPTDHPDFSLWAERFWRPLLEHRQPQHAGNGGGR